MVALRPVVRVAWWRFAALLLIVGVVLSPLRAVAAAIPVLIAYDVAVRPTAMVRVSAGPSLRPDRGSTPQCVYDNVPDGHDGRTKRRMADTIGSVRAYDGAINLADRHGLGEGAIYDAPAATTAAEDLGAIAQQIHEVLDPIAQDQRVTAVLTTREGVTLVGTGAVDMTAAQAALAQKLGLVPVSMAGEDAEITVIQQAASLGLTPLRGAIYGGPGEICGGCAAHITQIGGTVTGPMTFEFSLDL